MEKEQQKHGHWSKRMADYSLVVPVEVFEKVQ